MLLLLLPLLLPDDGEAALLLLSVLLPSPYCRPTGIRFIGLHGTLAAVHARMPGLRRTTRTSSSLAGERSSSRWSGDLTPDTTDDEEEQTRLCPASSASRPAEC